MTTDELAEAIKIKLCFFEKDNINKKSVQYIKGYTKCLKDILESIETDNIIEQL